MWTRARARVCGCVCLKALLFWDNTLAYNKKSPTIQFVEDKMLNCPFPSKILLLLSEFQAKITSTTTALSLYLSRQLKVSTQSDHSIKSEYHENI